MSSWLSQAVLRVTGFLCCSCSSAFNPIGLFVQPAAHSTPDKHLEQAHVLISIFTFFTAPLEAYGMGQTATTLSRRAFAELVLLLIVVWQLKL